MCMLPDHTCQINFGDLMPELGRVGRRDVAKHGDRKAQLRIASQPGLIPRRAAAVADFVQPPPMQDHQARGVGDRSAIRQSPPLMLGIDEGAPANRAESASVSPRPRSTRAVIGWMRRFAASSRAHWASTSGMSH
jgi:hypothetical protein